MNFEEYVEVFAYSMKNITEEMTGIQLNKKSGSYSDTSAMTSRGMTTVISFIGKIKCRLLLDMDIVLAKKFYEKIMRKEISDYQDIKLLSVISEVNNTVAGDANTILNNRYNLSLRLAPPVVFCGTSSVVSIPKVEAFSVDFDCEFGQMKMNLSFEGGEL